MIFNLIIWILVAAVVFLVGTISGRNGWIGDSRLDKLMQQEAYLIGELKGIQNSHDSFTLFLALDNLNRSLPEICAELSKVRAAIIQCGGAPCKLSPDLMKVLIENQ